MPMDINKISSAIDLSSNPKSETSKTNEAARIGERGEGNSSLGHGQFSKGRVFSGQITNISPKEITIELENGETMRAKYDNVEDLSIGDGARFKVVSNTDNLITIKALSHPNGSLESAVIKALDASGLPFSEKNEELITALLKNELPVNKQMLSNILQQSLKNPNISMTNLVLMNKALLPIDETTTAMFEAYSEGVSGFSEKADGLFQSMLEMIDGLLSNEKIEEAASLTRELLSVLDIGLTPDEAVRSNLIYKGEETFSPPADLQDFLTGVEALILKEGAENELTEENNASNQTLSSTPLSSIFSDEELLNIFSAFENSDVDAGAIQKLLTGELLFSDLSDLIGELSEEERNNPLLMPEALKDFSLQYFEKSNSSAFPELLPVNPTLSEAAEVMRTILSSSDFPSDQKAALLRSNELRQTLEMLVKTDFTISPDELLRDKSVSDYYRRVNSVLEQLSFAASKNPDIFGKLSENTNVMREQLQFLNTISHYYAFAELPLRLSGQTTTGDLYVYSDKKRKKGEGDDSISCLLHLDTANLGALNVRIELKENTVTTKFYLDDEESGKLIEKNLTELDRAIERQGLNPESEVVKVSKKETKTEIEKGRYNLVNDFIPSMLSKNHFKRYTFDVRA